VINEADKDFNDFDGKIEIVLFTENDIRQYNQSQKKQRQLRFLSECDIITVEIKRRELISDLTDEEKQILVNDLKTKSDLIKVELPYYKQINLK
jgi:hypothetical protein